MSIGKVQDIFKQVFENPDLLIRPDMTAQDVEGWDSFNHINLVLALELAFDITFTTEEIATMAKVDDLIVILRQKNISVSWD